MTARQQKALYFPAWNAAAKAHGWHLKNMAAQFPAFGGPELNQLYQRIWQIAEERLETRNLKLETSPSAPSAPLRPLRNSPSSPSPDDFRHACHIVAFGQDKSSSDLTNAELDRIVALFHLLADPDDLRATLTWSNPAEETRKRILWWLRQNCVESYLVAVTREKFDTDDWENLPLPKLRQLHMTLKHRPASRRVGTSRRDVRSPINVNRNTVAAEHCEAETNDPF